MNPQTGPSPMSMIPPQAILAAQRRNSDPMGILQQSPMASGLTPDAMASDPTQQVPPPPGSAAQNPMMTPPPGTNPGQPGLPGQPAPMDESTMILQALQDRLEHHSKITEKTIGTLTKMVEAGIPTDPNQQNAPTG